MNDFLTAAEIASGKEFPTPDIGIDEEAFGGDPLIEDLEPPKDTHITLGKVLDLEDYYARGLDPAITELDAIEKTERFILSVAIKNNQNHLMNPLTDDISVNLPSVLYAYKKDRIGKGKKHHAAYMDIYRAAERLRNRGIASVEKGRGGFIWIVFSKNLIKLLSEKTKTKMEAARERSFNLIKRSCEIPTGAEITEELAPKKSKLDPLATPRNARYERLEAIRTVQGISGKMNVADLRQISRLFTLYNDDVTEKIIALMDGKTGDLVGSEYSTRFNDTRKAAIALDKFDYAMDKAFNDYRYASFLTLTTDPKRFDNLWLANRHFAQAWNKFLSWLTKKNGRKRPEYIVAYEYTKSGLIHLHAIVFMEYIADVRDISEEWKRCDQGEIVHAYCLKSAKAKVKKYTKEGKKFVDGYEWRWRYNSPKRAHGSSGSDYLKAYLKKGVLSKMDRYANPADIQSLYWVFNKRFWSCTRRLLDGYNELQGIETEEDENTEDTPFVFWRVIHESDAEALRVRIIYKRGEEPSAEDKLEIVIAGGNPPEED